MGNEEKVSEQLNDLTYEINRCAMEVHKRLGPGLLESAYQKCMRLELAEADLEFQAELNLPLKYRGRRLPQAYRVDLLVERTVVVELKVVRRVKELHRAQLLTYMRLLDCPAGLLLNFNKATMKKGLTRKLRSRSMSE